MIGKLSTREILWNVIVTGGGLHLASFLFVDRTYAYYSNVMGVVALVLASGCFLLHYTKRTMQREEDSPSWIYIVAAGGWGVSGIAWLMGVFDVAKAVS